MKRIYLYSLGPLANHSPNHICCPVPKKINEKEIFFGPCIAKIRQRLYKEFLKSAILQEENLLIKDEIYLVGINSTSKGLPRRIIWSGRINELTTYKGAWDKIKSTSQNREKYNCLITGKD